RQQLAVMNAKFKALEDPPQGDPPESRMRPANGTAGQKDGNIFPAALAVPGLRFELEQLLRDRKIRESDLLLLMQRLEMAKVNEARDTSAFRILDPPPLPTYMSRPRRAVTLAGGLIFGILIGLVSVFGRSWMRILAD